MPKICNFNGNFQQNLIICNYLSFECFGQIFTCNFQIAGILSLFNEVCVSAFLKIDGLATLEEKEYRRQIRYLI